MPRWGARWLPALWPALLAAAGCEGPQNALDTGGPYAARIAELWWVMLFLGTVVFLATMGLLFYGLIAARRRSERDAGELPPAHARRLVVWGGVVVPIFIVAFLLVYSVVVGRALREAPTTDALVIDVIGHQFWWEVHYPHLDVITANEIHIPAGEPVLVRVTTADVIHSFWVPNLHGKIDMIPGRTNSLWIHADEPGTFRGQCAEFCGTQHALMAFHVIAQAPEEFEEWVAGQREPAPPPADPVLQRGLEVFHGSACVYCHTVRGTNASSPLGPDLTHFGSRRTIGSGILPNTPGNLAGWLIDPQAIKPGNKMPPTNLSGGDLQALLAYLYSLQ